MGAVKLEDLETPAETTKPEEEAPKMGEQKPEAKPAEVFVPKIPNADKEEKTEDEDKGLDATSFRMDMMVEEDEDVGATGGIFSGAKPVDKTIKPIQSALFKKDDVDFKGKTATHAESVFDTDHAIKEEQKEQEKAVEIEAAAEQGAKRANKAWGVGTGDAAEQAAETAKEEADKIKAGKKAEVAAEPKAEAAKTDETKSAPTTSEPAGIFTSKPAKGSFFKKFLGNFQKFLNKPVGKPKKDA